VDLTVPIVGALAFLVGYFAGAFFVDRRAAKRERDLLERVRRVINGFKV